MLEFTISGRTIFTVDDDHVGLAWTPLGVTRLILGRDKAAVRESLTAAADHPWLAYPKGDVAILVKRIKAHLKGRNDDFLDVPVDLSAQSEFSRQILNNLRLIPPGQVTTYGNLATGAGRKGAARAVGRIMGANPVPLIVPCHRCLGKDGSLTGFSAEGGIAIKARLLHREGYILNERYEAGMKHLRKVDPVMKKIIHRAGPYRALPDKPQPPWDTLVTAIVHQQLSVKASRTITQRVRALTPGKRLPTPQELRNIDHDDLRAVGLSNRKAGYVKDLAVKVDEGSLDLHGLKKLDDEAVILELTKVRGIGRWSAQMHLMFHLDRLDVLPTADLGLQMGAAHFYGLDDYATPAQLEEIAAPWQPYRSMGSWYLWQGLESGGI